MTIKSKFSFIALLAAMSFAHAQDKEVELPKCEKPIASVTVGKLQCRAANCNGSNAGTGGNPLLALISAQGGQANMSGIGDGVRDMMNTALQSTGCFEVMDREAMEEIAKELALVGKKVETKESDFLVSGAVTQIEVEKKSSSIGGGFIPIIGSVGRTTEKAAVSMDLRLVSVSSAKVLSSKTVQSTTENSSFGIGGAALGSIGGSNVLGFGDGFSALKGTNLEAVTRDAVLQATHFLVAEARRVKGVK